jgi:hypothetical protein
MKKAVLFGLAAIGALAVGIGAAEVQSRLLPKQSIAERAAAANALSAPTTPSASSQMVEEMVSAIRRPRNDVIESIRADCKYRFPGANDSGVRGACVDRQRGLFDQMRNLFDTADDKLARGAIIYCMNENRSLNGFDWQDVSWCYERNLVAMKKSN